MVDDVVTPLNPWVTPVEEEEVEETSLDMNVSQWLCEKDSSKKVVHTQVNRSAWDHRLFPNPHALVIYLEFVPTRRVAP
jgi:hypothetical protein